MMALEVMKHYPFSPVVQRKALSWLVSVSAEDYTRDGCCGEETAVSGLCNCMFDRSCLFLENCFVVVNKMGLLLLEINTKNGSAKS